MRKFSIINIDDEIDFDKVEQSSFETCRKSNDGLKMIVSYIGETPNELFIFEKYTQEEIKEIIKTENWKKNERIF